MATTVAEAGPRSKRAAILQAAVRSFGETGYEHTKWSAVADRVGIGQTALYHYFESKAHCLLTIMHMELARSADNFTAATQGLEPLPALRAAVRTAYDVKKQEVLQMRILHTHTSMLAHPRGSVREEEERQASRALVQQIEHNWTDLMQRGMDTGIFPERNATLIGRATLGLVISVWDWYRPGGALSLPEISDMMTAGVERFARGVDIGDADGPVAATPTRTRRPSAGTAADGASPAPDGPAPPVKVSAPSSRRPRTARSR
ncbi:TetR family transcriptional regulator [Nakamurella sp. YIM 132087]|uniref:TetR family transcriptional regulator n=1 Tax=Nakamurella alba TaxID=2665158 RepID=A0A7K1FT06_9ACTN|nr:TetR/AcrR family transcriptional regulator [Nakamurella alba]MTD17251.1 TetR family transcriptional regulator [Nakamurella alba]